jgi:hypothetical protein
LRNSDRLADTFRWSEDPSTAWLVPSTAEDAEDRFLQAGKGAENTKQKSRQCFTDEETLIRMKAGARVPEKVS